MVEHINKYMRVLAHSIKRDVIFNKEQVMLVIVKSEYK